MNQTGADWVMDVCFRAASCDLSGTLCPLCANEHTHPPAFCWVTHFLLCGSATALDRLWHCWSLVLIHERIIWEADIAETVGKGFSSRNRNLEVDFYQQNFQVTHMKSKYLRYNPLFLSSLAVV